MKFWLVIMVILFWVLFLLSASYVHACGDWSWCDREAARQSEPSRTYITNQHRQKTGDLYDPGNGRRVQIRNNHRQIIGYIEPSGVVTDTNRRPVDAIGTLTGEKD